MPDIVLTLSGQRHSGWESITLTRSIERVASHFDLTLSERWNNGEHRSIKSGEPCTVQLDNERLITGYTGTIVPRYDDKNHSISVQGRSKTADLVDCSLIGREFRNQTLDQIARALCKPFGINVVVSTPVGKPFNILRLATGQSIFEFLEYAARIRAVRLIDNPAGDLVIINAGTRYADTALRFGENILSARGHFDNSRTYNHYTVVSQQDGLTLSADAQASVNGQASDKRIKRHRPFTIEADMPADIADCTRRAQWEVNTRYGRGQSAVFTVAGWQQSRASHSRTWLPNELVHISDPWLSIQGERLITETRLIRDSQGSRTEITTLPKTAFTLQALPEPTLEEAWL